MQRYRVSPQLVEFSKTGNTNGKQIRQLSYFHYDKTMDFKLIYEISYPLKTRLPSSVSAGEVCVTFLSASLPHLTGQVTNNRPTRHKHSIDDI